jgi:hypothetical protein
MDSGHRVSSFWFLELQVYTFLKTVTLKNIAYIIELVQKNACFTIQNCWSKHITASEEGTQHEEQHFSFMEENVDGFQCFITDNL